MSNSETFAHLGNPRKIWAIAACHGVADRLIRMQAAIAERFTPGDRLVYLGNYLGGAEAPRSLDLMLKFRAGLLSRPGMLPGDFVYLRGIQEEIWSKLLQIQFAPNPREVLEWMLDRGGTTTIEAYGGDVRAGLLATREGAIAMTRWTSGLRDAMRRHPGHDKLMSVLQRAAFTEPASGGVLLVHAGLDPNRPLAAQGDAFWWNSAGFSQISSPFGSFSRIVRGFDPAAGGLNLTGYAVTLDGGCGRDGPLIAAAIAPDGALLELFEA